MEFAELLHISYAHFDDAALILALYTGMIHNPDGITSQAIRNNRLIRGPCPHCLAGKINSCAGRLCNQFLYPHRFL